MAAEKSITKSLVWIIMGLLVLGLGGFGVRNLSGNIRTIGSVGSEEITVGQYSRALQQELRATQAQTGQPLTMEQARAAGLDRAVLARLVTQAALDNEVASLGLSIGDKNLQKDILAIPAFQGADGSFDREAYKFALDQAGLNESSFEADLRKQSTRTLAQSAIMAGVTMPATLTDTIVDYVAARRSFTWAVLDAGALTTPVPAPTEDELRAWYDAHPDDYMLPETKRLTYVLLTPDMLIDQVEIDDAALKKLYDERAEKYNVPERRLVERLPFADEQSARDAMAQIEAGGTTFEKLVTDRGLTLADVDLGDVTAETLGDAADAVFAAAIGDVVGPLPSDLGPSLFRVNGKLAAHATPFEDAKQELRDELAADRARRLVDKKAQAIDDLLAGGATLEEIAGETDMVLKQTDWNRNSTDGIAAYDAFRKAAEAVKPEDYPAIVYLKDGGAFALRLDQTLPKRPEPFDSARDAVKAAVIRDRTDAALRKLAQEAEAKLAEGRDFAEAGLAPHVENGLTRTAYIDGTAADFMNQVFKMKVGEVRVIPADGTVHVVRLDAIAGPADNADTKALRDAISNQLNQTLSQALFQAFVNDARLRARPQIDQRAVNAVLASFQ